VTDVNLEQASLSKEVPAKKRRRRRRRTLIVAAIGAVVFLFLLALLIDSTLYSGKVHAGVTVSGIELGGMTAAEAKAALDKQVEQAQKNSITLTSGDKKWTVSFGDAGTEIDTAATVGKAMAASRKGNFFADRFRGFAMYFRDTKIPLEGTVDSAKVDQIISGIEKAVEVPPINAGLVFDGQKIKIVRGQKGRVVDGEALTSQLKTMLLSLHGTELAVPMTVKDPAVQADNYDLALQQAMTMTGSPLKLTDGDHSWTLTPEEIVAYMDFSSKMDNGVSILVPYLSADKMAPFLKDVAADVATSPVNATFKGDGRKAWVVPGVPGKRLDADKTAEALNTAVLDPKDRTVAVAVTLKQPSLTTDEAKAMGIKDKLADYQTVWKGTPDRQTNVKITTRYASNVLLSPGEVYDFDEQIGPRTAERGYKLAPGIVGPGKLEDVFGGGICQVSTTLFNAAFFAGLEIVERKNHSIYIAHYPKGRDATVSANGPNLRFRNDTKHYILIRGASDGITTKFVIYGTDEGRTVDYETSDFYDIVEQTVESTTNKSLGPGTSVVVVDGQEGKKVKVVRVVKNSSGKILHKDTFISVWPMLPQEIEIGTGKTTTTTGKTTTTTSKPTTTESTTTTTTTTTTGL
jgi:vancomycin resistance protein YoaR